MDAHRKARWHGDDVDGWVVYFTLNGDDMDGYYRTDDFQDAQDVASTWIIDGVLPW
jgi:hypothetical protein